MIGILGQVEEGWGRHHTEHVGEYFRVGHGSLHTLPSHPPHCILPQPSQLAGLAKGIMPAALFSIVAVLSLGLSGLPTFLWVQVTNKEIETMRNEKGNA